MLSIKQAQETLHWLGVPRLPPPWEVDSEEEEDEPRCDFCNRTHDEVMYEDYEENAWNGDTGCCKKCEEATVPFPPLPFDLVSRIIKEADGGRWAHKQQFDIVFGNWSCYEAQATLDAAQEVPNLTQLAIHLEIQEDSGAVRGKDLVGEHLGVTRVFTDFLEQIKEEEWMMEEDDEGNIWHFRNENLGWCVE